VDLAPDQLTERLRASRALPSGRVTAVHPGERRTTILSTIVPLRVEYSPDAPNEAPTRLLLKTSRDGLDPGLGSVGELLGYHIARDVFAPAPRDLAAGATTPADRMFGR
jgi:hypothetical protein